MPVIVLTCCIYLQTRLAADVELELCHRYLPLHDL